MKRILALLIGVPLGLLMSLAFIAVISAIFAGIIMLGWNTVIMAIIAVAVPMSFWTALKLCGIILLFEVARKVIKTFNQRFGAWALKKSLEMNVKASIKEAMNEQAKNPPDILRHFRMN